MPYQQELQALREGRTTIERNAGYVICPFPICVEVPMPNRDCNHIYCNDRLEALQATNEASARKLKGISDALQQALAEKQLLWQVSEIDGQPCLCFAGQRAHLCIY